MESFTCCLNQVRCLTGEVAVPFGPSDSRELEGGTVADTSLRDARSTLGTHSFPQQNAKQELCKHGRRRVTGVDAGVSCGQQVRKGLDGVGGEQAGGVPTLPDVPVDGLLLTHALLL